jgi:alpha-D-ribose 1-methylphosphonate 5-triphosphate diphosphatase PhnM
MAAVCHIYGIAKTFVAVGDSRAMGGCETAHHTIADVIEEADEKGEIRSERDLYIFCATASIRRNQLLQRHSDECVSFELYFAHKPNTVQSLRQ